MSPFMRVTFRTTFNSVSHIGLISSSAAFLGFGFELSRRMSRISSILSSLVKELEMFRSYPVMKQSVVSGSQLFLCSVRHVAHAQSLSSLDLIEYSLPGRRI